MITPFMVFLIQLPLPKHICEDNILNTVDISKDVDGFNIQNVGRLSINTNLNLSHVHLMAVLKC